MPPFCSVFLNKYSEYFDFTRPVKSRAIEVIAIIFKGISKRFLTEDNKQYHEIGNYWDYFAAIYGRENLLGLGLNWKTDSLEYVIGQCEGHMEYDLEAVRERYPDAVYKKIVLPDTGWKTYQGQMDRLSELYETIYHEGALLYEIESFFENGSCSVKIIR